MNIVGTVLSIFMLMFLGYALKKLKQFQAEDANLLGRVVLYVTLPAFVFDAIYNYHGTIPLSIAKVPLIAIIIEFVIVIIAYYIGKMFRLDRPTIGGLMLAAAFGNTGFLGYPVIEAVFRDRSALVTAALFDEIAMALPLYTIGMVIAASFAGEKTDIRQIIKSGATPAILAIPLSLCIRAFALPPPILNMIHYLANGTVPLAMLTLGLTISGSSLKGFALPVGVICALKLILLPVLIFFSLKIGGVTGVIHKSAVVSACMPSAVMACVVASRYGANERLVAGVIFISTLLSAITIPITLAVLGVS